MAYKGYNVEGKYQCNHPEEDFKNNKKGPIEMKRDNFVEYTHRNEVENLQYDVWNQPQEYKNQQNYSAQNSYQSINRPTYGKKYQQASKKNSNDVGVIIFLFLFFGLPIIFSILEAIVGILNSIF